MSVWQVVRGLVVFVLGVAIIVDALLERQDTVPKLIVGMIMVGVLPLDTLLWHRNGRDRPSDAQNSPPVPGARSRDSVCSGADDG